MREQPRGRCKFCFSSLLISLVLCGCNAADRTGDETSANVDRADSGGGDATNSGVAHRETDAIPKAKSEAADEALNRQARIARLTADLGAARAQQAELMRKQGEINARLEAHQEEGMAMLASLKSEMAKRQALESRSAGEGGDAGEAAARIDSLDERFSADARSKLEPALAKDQALFAELEAVNAELESVNSRVETLHAELTTLKDADLQSATSESNPP
jgi:chromosome segregation ATPase